MDYLRQRERGTSKRRARDETEKEKTTEIT
jgi:hypothetical protein